MRASIAEKRCCLCPEDGALNSRFMPSKQGFAKNLTLGHRGGIGNNLVKVLIFNDGGGTGREGIPGRGG